MLEEIIFHLCRCIGQAAEDLGVRMETRKQAVQCLRAGMELLRQARYREADVKFGVALALRGERVHESLTCLEKDALTRVVSEAALAHPELANTGELLDTLCGTRPTWIR